MKFVGIGLAAALAVAFLAPAAASAAGPKVDPAARAKAIADTTPLLAQAGVTCTPTNAVYLGQSQSKEGGKVVMTQIYEDACQEGLGQVVLSKAGAPKPDAFDCLALAGVGFDEKGAVKKGALVCTLPENANPKAGLTPLMQKAGVSSCAVDKGRWVGMSPTDLVNQYEAGCANGDAYLLNVPLAGSARPLLADNCIHASLDGSAGCHFLTKVQAVQKVVAMSAGANRPACQVTDARWVGASPKTRTDFFEVACADTKAGYMFESDASGRVVATTDCAKADLISGGCTLTSVAVAGDTSDLSTYAGLVKQIGYSCVLTKYRSLGLDPSRRENVEVACSDHADGAFTLLPTDKGQVGDTYDCVRAEARSQTCRLSSKDATFPKTSAQISALGKSCQVTDSRGIGQTADGKDLVEVKCASGEGYFAYYAKTAKGVSSVQTCKEAGAYGGGCKLK